MQSLSEKSETGCCRKFNPDIWDGKSFTLDNLFIQDKILTFFNIPLNFAPVMKKNAAKLQKHNAHTGEMLMLYECRSPFHASLYISALKDVPESKMVVIKGEFLSKVFEGHYKNIGNWTKEMHRFVKSKNKNIKKMYLYYTTCPRCAQYYGKNYVVFLAEV